MKKNFVIIIILLMLGNINLYSQCKDENSALLDTMLLRNNKWDVIGKNIETSTNGRYFNFKIKNYLYVLSYETLTSNVDISKNRKIYLYSKDLDDPKSNFEIVSNELPIRNFHKSDSSYSTILNEYQREGMILFCNDSNEIFIKAEYVALYKDQNSKDTKKITIKITPIRHNKFRLDIISKDNY